jgi:DNA-binding NarL/FixJ family response regulator
VIALSGRPEARQAALAAGANDFVSKSDPPDRLLAAIDGCCASDRNPQHDREDPDDRLLHPTLSPVDGV